MARTIENPVTDRGLCTWSFWVKRCNLGTVQNIYSVRADAGDYFKLFFNTSNQLEAYNYWSVAAVGHDRSVMLFRDTTNWYHIMCCFDVDQAAQADIFRVWVNGVEITMTHVDDWDNNVARHFPNFPGGTAALGMDDHDNDEFLDAYLAEFHFQDGTIYTDANVFGKFKNGVWIPINIVEQSLTYGNSGFYLPFSNSADFGSDQSGNSNDWTDANLNTNDQVVDTPTNNYCTLNVLDKSLAGMTLSDGNLKGTAGAAQDGVRGTTAIPTSGKWYFEMDCSNSGWYGGICNQDFTLDGDTGDDADACTFLDNSTTAYIESADKAAYWEANPAGNTVGVCVNMDDLEIHFTNNAEGEQTVFAFGATSGDTWFPYGGGNGDSANFNFGQQGFTLTPPYGYKALNTSNIAATYKYTSDIMNPTWGFNTVTYQGDDGATKAITGVDHQSDLVWIKNRSQADSHYLCDSVRGVTKFLESDSGDAEVTDANDGISSFDVDGFTVMFNALDIVNAAGENYIVWCYKKDSNYGFDIVSDTGTGAAHAINHNLGGAPELIIRKNRDVAARSWPVYHHHALNKTDPETDYGVLDIANAWDDSISLWNDTAPTSTQFAVGTNSAVNENTKKFITYLWRSISGFSKVFSYKGNGNADGPYVHCGFRPKFIMIKNVDVAARSWLMYDSARSVYNPVDKYVYAELANAEGSGSYEVDFLSNGFKMRSADNQNNQNTNIYIGIAMAELPGVYSNSR